MGFFSNDGARTGLFFGATSGVITTIGLITGLHAGTRSVTAVLGGIFVIAVADAVREQITLLADRLLQRLELAPHLPEIAAVVDRLAARIVLYGGAIFVGLPLATSQILVGTIRSTAGEPRPPWTETSIASGDLRLRAWIAEGEPGRPSASCWRPLCRWSWAWPPPTRSPPAAPPSRIVRPPRGSGGPPAREPAPARFLPRRRSGR